jgi:hypothetical protein
MTIGEVPSPRVLKARVEVPTVPVIRRTADLGLVEFGRDGGDAALVLSAPTPDSPRDVVVHLAQLVVTRPVDTGSQGAVLQTETELQVVEALAKAFTRDDVDGAGDRPGAGFGSGSAQDLDALDHLGIDRIQREPALHAFAIEQDLGVATAQAAHPDGASAAWPATDGDAG